MKSAILIMILCTAWSFPGNVKGASSRECLIPGERIQWIADYCMASIGTDDEIAASDCMAKEDRKPFRSSCAAKGHYKEALCKVLIERGLRRGSVKACVDDPTFAGSTVRNGGVGS